MSMPWDEFYDCIGKYEHNKLILLDYGDMYEVLPVIKLVPTDSPNNKDLRLALDLIDEIYPLFKSLKPYNKREFLKDVMKMDVSTFRLKRLNCHKQILFKRVIIRIKSGANYNQIIIKRVTKQ